MMMFYMNIRNIWFVVLMSAVVCIFVYNISVVFQTVFQVVPSKSQQFHVAPSRSQ